MYNQSIMIFSFIILSTFCFTFSVSWAIELGPLAKSQIPVNAPLTNDPLLNTVELNSIMAAQSMDSYKTPYTDENVYLDGSPDMYQNYDYGVNSNNNFNAGFPADYDSGKSELDNSRNERDLRDSYNKKDGYDYDNSQADDLHGQDNFDAELDKYQGRDNFEGDAGYQNSNNPESYHHNSGSHEGDFNEDHSSQPGYEESNGEEASRSHDEPESAAIDSYESENSGGDGNRGEDSYQNKGGEYDKGKEETADYEDSPKDVRPSDDLSNHFSNTMKKNFRSNHAQNFQNDAFFANYKPNYGTYKQPYRNKNLHEDNGYKSNEANTRYKLYQALRLHDPVNTVSTAYLYQPQLSQGSLFGSLDTPSAFTSSFLQPQSFGQSFFNTLATPQFEEYYTSPQFASEFADYKVITRK